MKALHAKDISKKDAAAEAPNLPATADRATSTDTSVEGEMLSELATLFSGDLARYRNVLVLADDPREAISGAQFLQPQTLSTLMARFRPQFATADQRGLASIWANQYFMRLFPPVISAALLLDHYLV